MLDPLPDIVSDKRADFIKHVQPLFKEVHERCRELDIPVVLIAQVAERKTGGIFYRLINSLRRSTPGMHAVSMLAHDLNFLSDNSHAIINAWRQKERADQEYWN